MWQTTLLRVMDNSRRQAVRTSLPLSTTTRRSGVPGFSWQDWHPPQCSSREQFWFVWQHGHLRLSKLVTGPLERSLSGHLHSIGTSESFICITKNIFSEIGLIPVPPSRVTPYIHSRRKTFWPALMSYLVDVWIYFPKAHGFCDSAALSHMCHAGR